MKTATFRLRNVLGYRCEAIKARFDMRRFDRHFHETFSIGLVTGGLNAFAYRRRRVEVPAGAICIADPGEVHDGGLAGLPWSYANVFVPPALLASLLAEEDVLTEPTFADGIVVDRATALSLADLFRALFAVVAESETVDELAVLAFGRLLKWRVADDSPTRNTEASPIAARAIEVINDHRGKDVSLSLLSQETGTSRYGVIRSVSSAIGLTPVSYMIQLRVDHAKELIRAGMPIAEAAFESGFADQSHLTRAMRQRWGITPSTLKLSL